VDRTDRWSTVCILCIERIVLTGNLGFVAREKRRMALKTMKERLENDLQAVEHRIHDNSRANPANATVASRPGGAKRLSV
jgi:hypothetical protein